MDYGSAGAVAATKRKKMMRINMVSGLMMQQKRTRRLGIWLTRSRSCTTCTRDQIKCSSLAICILAMIMTYAIICKFPMVYCICCLYYDVRIGVDK